jgi:multidrug efflux system outer membrane protein
MNRAIAAPLMAICALLYGCAVGPNYKRPELNAPGSFRGETQTSTNSLGELPWWQVFRDEKLQDLIRVALTNNFDLRIAVARVEQARALEAEARAGFFPQLGYNVFGGGGKNIGAGGTPAPTHTKGAIVGYAAGASWEIDMWGRIRRLNEAARAQFLASTETRRDILISITAQVAESYFQLLALERELDVARRATNSYAESSRLFTQRLQGGVSSKLETVTAQALYDSAAATIPQLENQIVAQENQLSVLLGQYPGAIHREGSQLENQKTPEIPAGLPSTLVERRPDIRAVEQQLRAANAQVGVAFADFFPRLNLTGMLGNVAPDLAAFTGGGSFAWSAAAGLTGPVFQGGRLSAAYRYAKAARDQSALQYQATVINAFREVSNALVARQKLADAREEQARAVDAYRQAIDVATERYRLGRSSYYEVLQEQLLLFPAENSLVQIELNQLLAVVQLYRALGGGWEVAEANASALAPAPAAH